MAQSHAGRGFWTRQEDSILHHTLTRSRTACYATLLAMALVVLGASCAQAKTVTLGRGYQAHVAVDSDANALIAWSQSASPSDFLRYCKLAPGHTSCSAQKSITDASRPLDGGGYAFPYGGDVLLLDSRCCLHYDDRFLYNSPDLGRTFEPRYQIGADNKLGAGLAGGALLVPPGAFGYPGVLILTINGVQSEGATFQATTTNAGQSSSSFSIDNGHDTSTGSIARKGNTLLAAFTDGGNDRVYWRRWNSKTDINSSASWSARAPVGTASAFSGAQLAGGQGGIYLAYNTGRPTHSHWVLRKFNGSGFGNAVTLSDPTTGSGALAEGPSGRIYFAWDDGNYRLRYRFTNPIGGMALSDPRPLIGPNAGATYAGLDLAVNGHDRAWLTWADGSPTKVKALAFAR